MQISSRFTIAMHMLMCIVTAEDGVKVTSDFLADSIGVNPVIIRSLLSKLKNAGLIDVKRGTGGASLLKTSDEITFYDIYTALGCMDNISMFHFHQHPNPNCFVGRNIHDILDDKLDRIQTAMELELKAITLADVNSDLSELLKNGK